jgi:hypothetical protein
MDTSKLKKFAQYARRSLMEQVTAKLKRVLAAESPARRERPEVVAKLEEHLKRQGEAQVVERVAYTWFNRFCALRFMDVNGYNRIGVVSPAVGQFQPEILAEAKMGYVDEAVVPTQPRQQILALLDGTASSPDPQAEAYRLLVVAVCNDYHRIMPYLFERIDDYTELLMPDDLLSGNSILAYTREAMTPEACGEEVGSGKWEVGSKEEEEKLSTLHSPLSTSQPLSTLHSPLSTFLPDADNVIPMLDGDWFTDDIVERFRKFLRVTFGEEHYEENLRFVEKALNTKGKRNYGIRDYFLGEFYTDHVKRYKKRPIYWLFSSPKGSFNALIYMHRYRPDTVSIVLNEYLRELRTKLVAETSHQERISISDSASASDKTKALKEIEDLTKRIQELDDYERDVLYPLATQQIAIDLDDGVKVNYPKFGKALKKIPGLEAKED